MLSDKERVGALDLQDANLILMKSNKKRRKLTHDGDFEMLLK
jgi:hypothetical protein